MTHPQIGVRNEDHIEGRRKKDVDGSMWSAMLHSSTHPELERNLPCLFISQQEIKEHPRTCYENTSLPERR